MTYRWSWTWTLLSGTALLAWPGLSKEMTLEDLADPDAQPEVLGRGYGFCEGPAADPVGNIYFSDGKNDTIHFYETGKPVVPWVTNSLDANGMMFNPAGELVVCEGAAFRVVAYNVTTRTYRVLVGGGPQREFNEPNDLAVDRYGGFYFTDPNYRHRGQEAIRKEDVYYVAPDGRVTCVSKVCQKPNGILLSADERYLYVADNAGRCLYRYDVLAPGQLTNEVRWVDLDANPDGMTADEHGNIYVACGRTGIRVVSPSGRIIGTVLPGRYASNVVFGGPDFRTLFITSQREFLALRMKVRGVLPWGARR